MIFKGLHLWKMKFLKKNLMKSTLFKPHISKVPILIHHYVKYSNWEGSLQTCVEDTGEVARVEVGEGASEMGLGK